MANKVDVRIVKSKESLMSAMIGLLGKKKLEDLTISEIWFFRKTDGQE